MALAILAAVFLGFARSFFLRAWYPEPRGAPETFFSLHGAVFTAWFVLLRRLGTAGALLAVAMVAMGTAGALIAARRPGGFLGIDVPPLRFLAIPLFDMALFGLMVGLAVARRSDPQTHKRLMLVASVAIITAAVARWPFAFMKDGSGTSRPAAGCTRPRCGPDSRSWSRSRSACGCPAPRGGWPSRGGRPVSGGDVPGT
jgi:hypothetical protein